MKLTVKVFIGPWCPACEQALPGITELLKSYDDISYEVIDAYSNTQLSDRYNISLLPTLIFEANENVVAKTEGKQLISLYTELVDRWK